MTVSMDFSLLVILALQVTCGQCFPQIPGNDRILSNYKDIPAINLASGLNLFEGDIKRDSTERNTIIGSQYRWPRTVPYYLEDSLEINAKGVILKAFERFRLKTCLDFKPWNGESNYISVFSDNGCYSYVGMGNGKQQLSIGIGCDRIEIVQHEFLHALGFYHEQSRSDRDDYVTILWDNIQPGKSHNFLSYSDTKTSFLGVPYDYISVMHYSNEAFSSGNATIQTKNAVFNNLIGKQMDLSANDVLKLNQLYNCTSSITFLDSCSFESDDLCAMLQSSTDISDWQYVSSVPEGPDTDHTYMEKKQGFFMHFDTSSGKIGDEAILESRLFYPARGFQCLEFFYYHSGNESDRLNIWIKEYINDIPVLTFVNSVNGPPADYWQIHHSKLGAKNTFRFVFQGIKGDDNGHFIWDNPAVSGHLTTYPNKTSYNITFGLGTYIFTAEEWLYRCDFLKGGDAFVSISMEDISHLKLSQPIPVTTSPLCNRNICLNGGTCIIVSFTETCRCPVYEHIWFTGERCEIYNTGNFCVLPSFITLLVVVLVIVNHFN
ncbi:meprin A subunit beta-like isoform X2 [Ranitomeya imitator]|uniref:meprin A subunit beta-like isoform X2 n=1 Tax=Ranitomeya imitator TaxID=111125 RepID=UPI0037E962E5